MKIMRSYVVQEMLWVDPEGVTNVAYKNLRKGEDMKSSPESLKVGYDQFGRV